MMVRLTLWLLALTVSGWVLADQPTPLENAPAADNRGVLLSADVYIGAVNAAPRQWTLEFNQTLPPDIMVFTQGSRSFLAVDESGSNSDHIALLDLSQALAIDERIQEVQLLFQRPNGQYHTESLYFQATNTQGVQIDYALLSEAGVGYFDQHLVSQNYPDQAQRLREAWQVIHHDHKPGVVYGYILSNQVSTGLNVPSHDTGVTQGPCWDDAWCYDTQHTGQTGICDGIYDPMCPCGISTNHSCCPRSR